MQKYFKNFLVIATLIGLTFVISCSSKNSANEAAKNSVSTAKTYLAGAHKTVLMISIDGFRTDYMEMYQPPNLTKLAQSGVRARGMYPSFPSLTFPNHMTLVTGLVPGHNGIVSNFFFDKKRQQPYGMSILTAVNDGSWYHGLPLWAAVENAGYHAATYFWVGSEADIAGVHPTIVKHYDESVSNQARADEVINWLHFAENDRPALINLYFSAVDSMGHAHGPNSQEVKNAVLEIDTVIGSIMADVEKSSLPVDFVVVSDHGMLEVKETIDLSTKADLSQFDTFEKGAVMTLVAKNSFAIDSAYQQLKSNERNYHVYRFNEIPARYKYTDPDRCGDMLVVADPGYYVLRGNGSPEPVRVSAATHGWDPWQTPQMQALFIASGPSFKHGLTIPAFDNTNVYPMVLEVLGLNVPVPIDGDAKVLHGIIGK